MSPVEGSSWVEAWEAVKHPTVYRAAPTTESCPGRGTNFVGAEALCSRASCSRPARQLSSHLHPAPAVPSPPLLVRRHPSPGPPRGGLRRHSPLSAGCRSRQGYTHACLLGAPEASLELRALARALRHGSPACTGTPSPGSSPRRQF